MKTSEIKDLTTEEIKEKIETEKAALTKMKMNHAVSPLGEPDVNPDDKKKHR